MIPSPYGNLNRIKCVVVYEGSSLVQGGRNSARECTREGTRVTLQKIKRLAVACRGEISRILLLRRII